MGRIETLDAREDVLFDGFPCESVRSFAGKMLCASPLERDFGQFDEFFGGCCHLNEGFCGFRCSQESEINGIKTAGLSVQSLLFFSYNLRNHESLMANALELCAPSTNKTEKWKKKRREQGMEEHEQRRSGPVLNSKPCLSDPSKPLLPISPHTLQTVKWCFFWTDLRDKHEGATVVIWGAHFHGSSCYVVQVVG
ncbi:hypothetical protein HHK36_016599 [Tetracentron sinense]|uniref:Uncharacterized protein n=1 Tax=Tetracentron sinense TaxID=13715 RepID=A0A835DBN8_TETSI|nr:hypothetical protein HHK36_016599 [Tetracentron sinense]